MRNLLSLALGPRIPASLQDQSPTAGRRDHAAWLLGLIGLIALVAASVAYAQSPTRETGLRCASGRSRSRWVAAGDVYRRRQDFGRDPQWLGTLAGVGADDGRVFVFDEGKPAIVELDSRLRPTHEFGRNGDGPGEISGGIFMPFMSRIWDRNFLGFRDSAITVFDREEVEVFAQDGTFRYRVEAPHGYGPFQFGLRYVEPDGPDAILIVNDSVDVMGRAPRRLQVWRVAREGPQQRRTLLWSVELPWQQGPAGLETLAREARPLWSRWKHCQAATDGSGPFLMVYDEQAPGLDSLPLPAWPVPDYGDHADDRFRPSFAKGPAGGPSAILRWMDLVVDPDGWAWVRAWTGRESGEVVVFAVSLSSGEVVRIQPPAFPRAFGAPGEYYAAEVAPETDEQLLVRYSAEEAGRP